MPNLTKNRVVLVLGDRDEDWVRFQTQEATEEPTLFISQVDWDDMDQPETVTVTIEPGDLLND